MIRPRLLPIFALPGLLWASPAAAQTVQLPCAVASQQTIGGNEKNLIARYAKEGADLLASEDPADVQRGRERLLTPLRCPDVSAAFRVEYGNALQAAVRDAIQSGDDFRAANALLVAGMVASNNSVQAIDSALKSPRETVRAAAAVALQHTLREQVTGRARLTSTVAEGAVAGAGARLAVEPSPAVAESILVALRVGADRQSPLVSQSIRAIGQGVAGVFKAARAQEDPDLPAWTRAAERAAEALWRATYDAQSRQVDQAESLAVAEGGAQILAYARDRAANQETPLSDEERQSLSKAIDSAEGSLILIHSRLAGGASIEKSLTGAFADDPDRFIAEADQWIGAQGRLTRAPYRFKAEDLAASD